MTYIIFDTNVLNNICKFINDPRMFINFALTCSKTRMIAILHKDDKMDEFSTKFEKVKLFDIYKIFDKKVTKYKLPNGNLHGLYSSSDLNNLNRSSHKLYYNAICLMEWFYYRSGYPIITRYRCNCTKHIKDSHIDKHTYLNLDYLDKKPGYEEKNKCPKCEHQQIDH